MDSWLLPLALIAGLLLLARHYQRSTVSRRRSYRGKTMSEAPSLNWNGQRSRGKSVGSRDTNAKIDGYLEASRTGDLLDTPLYLRRQGWEPVSGSPEWYLGRYQAGETSMVGAVHRTPGGRHQFFVQDPPRTFIRNAEGGRCLTPRDELGDDVYEVHFYRSPDTLGDGIHTIETMLTSKYD